MNICKKKKKTNENKADAVPTRFRAQIASCLKNSIAIPAAIKYSMFVI